MLKGRFLLVVTLVFFCCASLGFAADQDQDRAQTKDQLKDGSCQEPVTSVDTWRIIAEDQDRTRDRAKDQLKDGSCQEPVTSVDTWRIIAEDQDRTRDRTKDQLKDGSCQS